MDISNDIFIVYRDDWDGRNLFRIENPYDSQRLNRRIEGAYLDYTEAHEARKELEAPDKKPRLDSYRRSWDHALFPQFGILRLKEFARSMGCP